MAISQSIDNKTSIRIGEIEKGLSIKSTLKSIPIIELKKDIGEEHIWKAVLMLVKKSNNFHSVYGHIDLDQASDLADYILEQMDYDSFDDIVLMFQYARNGKLKTNGFEKKKSFQATVLQDWIPAFRDLKYQEREKFESEKKKEFLKVPEKTNLEGISQISKLAKEMKLRSVEKNRSKLSPLNNDDHELLIGQIWHFAKNRTYAQLEYDIVEWSKFSDRKHYVHIFETEKSSRDDITPSVDQPKSDIEPNF